jgi:hypothetical protein
MKSIFDKLNLRPQERRLVVIVGIIVFAVVNFWFIIPHFGDLGRLQNKKDYAQKTLAKYRDELAKRDQYARDEKRLSEIGGIVPSEEQALQLQLEVDAQARQSGVMVLRYDASRTGSQQRTNSFFEEQTLVITVNTGEKELIEFLYGLGKGQSLTRVSSMSLQRDPTQTKLGGSITLVKSFQKKAPRAAPTAVIAAAAKAPATKPTPTKPAPATATNVATTGTNQPRRTPLLPKK